MAKTKLLGTVELGQNEDGFSVRLVDLQGLDGLNLSGEQIRLGDIEYLKSKRTFQATAELKSFLNSLNLKEPAPSAPAVMLGNGVMGRMEFNELTLEKLVEDGLLKPVNP